MWQQRNNILHEAKNQPNFPKKKYALKQRVKELYKVPRIHLNKEDKRLFKLPLNQRCKGSATSIILWINMVEMMFKKAKTGNQKTITQWTEEMHPN